MKRKIIEIASVILCAAVGGVFVGQYYANSFAGVVKAENAAPLPPGPDPEWKDLNVVYLVSAEGIASNKVFDPTDIAPKINAQALNSAADMLALSQTQRLDVVIIDKPALQTVDSAWAADQYKHGTAFVGFNITPKELGALVNDPDFANAWDWQKYVPPEPFVSQTMWRVGGDPEQIRQLEELDALYPPNETNSQIWIKLNISDVTVLSTHGYTDVTAENLVNQLDNIRINIDNVDAPTAGNFTTDRP